jgi:acetolactate synthase-1/2/3 large subunit
VSIQEQEIDVRPTFDDISHFPTPDNAEPPKAALAKALEILSRAKRPFIFCGRGGRSEAEWNNRIKLAERLSARTSTHMKLPA